MQDTDVVIVGGGLAGATVAAMLGRSGTDTLLIDPHETFPDDFRCEKFDEPQFDLLAATGLADEVLAGTTPIGELWIARRGRLVERTRTNQYGFDYPSLVNAIRRAAAPPARFVAGKVASIETGDDRQTLCLADGGTVRARLVVMASGLNNGLRQTLGLSRELVSPDHSVSVRFDMVAKDRPFAFPALTYYPETVEARIAYLTLFRVGGSVRANFFCYRDLDDPWIRALRADPAGTLLAAMPRLRSFTGDFDVPGPVRIRPIDLYQTGNHLRPGIVLVGDAFATACPVAGTGASKVLTDVVQLCRVHIPRWLATPGMGADKIATFYDDPVKRRCDADSAKRARFAKSLATDPSLAWQIHRSARFAAQRARGLVRWVPGAAADPAPLGPAPAES